MSVYLTKDDLLNWAGTKIYDEGVTLFEAGRVQRVECEGSFVEGSIGYGDRIFNTRFEVLPDGTVDNSCPCKDSRERGIVCSHVIAVAMAWADRVADPCRERERRIKQRMRGHATGAMPSGYLSRFDPEKVGVVPARLHIKLCENWREAFLAGSVPLSVKVSYKNSRRKPELVDESLPLAFSKRERWMLYVLEDFLGEHPIYGDMKLNQEQFLELLCEVAPGSLPISGEQPALELLADVLQPHLTVRFSQQDGTLQIHHTLEIPGDNEAPANFMITRRMGWVEQGGRLWQLDPVLPPAIRDLYRQDMVLPRENIPSFMFEVLPDLEEQILIDSDIGRDAFTIEQGTPTFELMLGGDFDCMTSTLFVQYGDGQPLIAGRQSGSYQTAFPADDLYTFQSRNPDKEDDGLKELILQGIKGMDGNSLDMMFGQPCILNFLARNLPALKQKGWKVSFSGAMQKLMLDAVWVRPELTISQNKEPGWYDVQFSFSIGNDQYLDELDIEDAVLMGESYIRRDGKLYLLDSKMVEAVNAVFDDCSVRNEVPYQRLTVGDIHAGYVMLSLDDIEGVRVDTDESWDRQVDKQNRKIKIEPVNFDGPLGSVLRSYQKVGVSWLRYMEVGGFSGILADEMGLGKTVQTLAWLQLQRVSKTAEGLPSLIVCPTSLVENWEAEAKQFTPNMKVYLSTGANRHKTWDQLKSADLVITSYALLRRDIKIFTKQQFAAAVLDEAQHIKNHSTQNAKSTKLINAFYRLVLTGTPIENSVTDLWSIMDFLMPGYLGSHQQFRYVYEMPISNRTADAVVAQERLRRKIHPFLLRRLKAEVAKDLPPKIERIAVCTMTKDQREVYSRLLSHYRSQIYDMVQDQGFEKTRFEIFKTLLRLRQTCCHLALLKDPDIKYKEPSGKLDLFHELLDEAIDGGNRLLVFSQFVSMLKILKEELEKRKLPYAYLDGSTKERLKIVNEFNADKNIPVFLISLKAGGTGLNLTGADTVIHFDPWWNPAVEDQATDRAHRIGQQRTVYSVKLITKDSIEEKVLEMQRRKKAIIDATLAREEQIIEKLSWDDVQELLKG